MWLNLHGCQAVQHKLKKGVKTHTKNNFYPLFELISESLPSNIGDVKANALGPRSISHSNLHFHGAQLLYELYYKTWLFIASRI